MTFGTTLTGVAGLALVLALVLLAARAVRAFGIAPGLPARPGATPRSLVLAETLALDPRRRLVLVRCNERELLILTGGPQDILLAMPEGRQGAVAPMPDCAAR